MLSAREYVEMMTCRRLNSGGDDIDNSYYIELCDRLYNLLKHYSETQIIGFTQDDIEGFLLMDIHKALRFHEFDDNLPPYPYFKTRFDKLTKNIHRNMNRAIKNLNSDDLIDKCDFFGDFRF